MKKLHFEKSRVKEIDLVSDKFLFKSKHLKFLDWVSKYNLINIEIVKNRLNELPKNMFGIGNNFLIEKNSDLESLIKKN